MPRFFRTTPVIIFFIIALLQNLSSCSRIPVVEGATPIVTTSSYQLSSGNNNVKLKGQIDNYLEVDFGSVYEIGFYWGTSKDTPDRLQGQWDTGGLSFSGTLYALNPVTTYYFKAYITCSQGTICGSVMEFSTQGSIAPDVDYSIIITNSTSTSVDVEGTLLHPGIPAYTECGFCYSTTNSTPTIYDGKVTAAVDENKKFSATITGLTAGKNYYIRGYATNTALIDYSSAITVTPQVVTPPSLTTGEVTDITNSSCTFNASVSSLGSPMPSQWGFCYSTSPAPTVSDNTLTTTVYAGAMTVKANSLKRDTKYYVRAYGRSNFGVTYGNEMTFNTLQGELPTFYNMSYSPSNITLSSAELKGEIKTVGDPAYTSCGICYSSEKEMPTIEDKKVESSKTNGTGVYTVTLAGLNEGTAYYARAYAISEMGVAYGSQMTFKTREKPTVKTYIAQPTNSSVRVGCIVSNPSGFKLDAGGVYWGTSPDNLAKLEIGNLTYYGNSLATTLNELDSQTTYYLKGYITLEDGTEIFGTTVSFNLGGGNSWVDWGDGSTTTIP